MENRDDLFEKTPFYMTYPMQNLYLTEMEYEKDMERMKAMYPREVSQLQQMVERRCDEMEYEGSRMYDENPDRMMLEEEARRLYERFLRENPQYNSMMPSPMPRPEGPMDPRPMPRPDMSMPRPDMPMQRPDMQMPRPSMQPRDGMQMPRPNMQPRDGMQMQAYSVEDELSSQQYRRRRDDDPWLRSLINVLFFDEIYRRRCRNRRCRRWW